jgi:hypothetical protein
MLSLLKAIGMIVTVAALALTAYQYILPIPF